VAIWQLLAEGRPRLARGPVGDGPAELLDAGASIDGVLGGDPGALEALLGAPAVGPVPGGAQPLAPVGSQPVWAAGVTFLRSRDARLEESEGLDAYDKVYLAERPELFLKALPGTARGPGQPIGVRADSHWDVPEPELALVVDRRGRIAGYTIGDDVSSRSI
jgi:2-dehydro-3-deoxy-D-arabinonate dehydratase